MLKIDTQVLVTLRYRFEEQISEADILAWLYNFEESDWGTALTLLNQVSFYSETRCANVLEDGLQQIIRAHSGMPIKSAKTRCDANVKRKVTFLCKTKSNKKTRTQINSQFGNSS